MSEPATAMDPLAFAAGLGLAILTVALPTWLALGYAAKRWGWHRSRAATLGLSLAAFVGAFWWLSIGSRAKVAWMAAYGEEIAFLHLAAGAGTLLAVGIRQLGLQE